MSLTLYYHPLSSFCHKVLIALYETGCEFNKRLIDLGNEADRAELRALWPFCKFPVLHDHAKGRNVAETTIIIEYLDHFFAGKERLIPADWDSALAVRHWDRVFDHYLQQPIQRIVGDRISKSGANLDSERATLQTAYSLIDGHIAGKKWMAGQHFTLADCAAAPALFYARTVQPIPAEYKSLNAYFERLMARPSVARVIEEAQPYFSMYPFADALEQRFRPAPT